MLRLDFQKPRRVSLRRHKKEPPRLQVKGSNSPASCKPQRLLMMVLYASLGQKSICPSKMQCNRNNSSAGLAIGRNAVFSCFAKLRGIHRQRCWRRAAAHLPCRSALAFLVSILCFTNAKTLVRMCNILCVRAMAKTPRNTHISYIMETRNLNRLLWISFFAE